MFKIAKSLFFIVAVVAFVAGSTDSVFSDQASVVGNEFSTGIFPTPTPTPTPTPSPSVSDNVRICHATGNGDYQEISPNAQGVINGHVGASHQAGEDIIPPFDYGDPIEHFPGQNWDTAGQAIYNNNCEAVLQE